MLRALVRCHETIERKCSIVVDLRQEKMPASAGGFYLLGHIFFFSFFAGSTCDRWAVKYWRNIRNLVLGYECGRAGLTVKRYSQQTVFAIQRVG